MMFRVMTRSYFTSNIKYVRLIISVEIQRRGINQRKISSIRTTNSITHSVCHAHASAFQSNFFLNSYPHGAN